LQFSARFRTALSHVPGSANGAKMHLSGVACRDCSFAIFASWNGAVRLAAGICVSTLLYCVGISIMRMQHSRASWPEVTIGHRRWLHSPAASSAAQLRVFSLRARLRSSGLSQLSKITGGTAITITLFGDFVIITWLPIMILAQDIFINMLLSSAPPS